MSRGLRNYAAQAAEYYGKTTIESVVLTTPKRILTPMHAPLALNVCMWMRACVKIGTRHEYVGRLVQYLTLMIPYMFRTKHEGTMADDHGRLSLHDRRRRQQAQNINRTPGALAPHQSSNSSQPAGPPAGFTLPGFVRSSDPGMRQLGGQPPPTYGSGPPSCHLENNRYC